MNASSIAHRTPLSLALAAILAVAATTFFGSIHIANRLDARIRPLVAATQLPPPFAPTTYVAIGGTSLSVLPPTSLSVTHH